jgi:hypothetical protein
MNKHIYYVCIFYISISIFNILLTSTTDAYTYVYTNICMYIYIYILGDSIIDQTEAVSVENLPQFQPLRTASSILPLIRKETLPDQLQHYRRNLKWMKKTRFVNTLYMHPQERNIHGIYLCIFIFMYMYIYK